MQNRRGLTKYIYIFSVSAYLLSTTHAFALATTESQINKSTSASLVDELLDHVERKKYRTWATDLDWTHLKEFYKTRRYTPIWVDANGPLYRAVQLRDAIVKSHEHGLDPQEYHAPVIRYLWRSTRSTSLIRLELLLSDAFLRYSVEVQSGYQYPRVIDNDWYVYPTPVDPVKALYTLILKNNIQEFLDSLPPPHAAYQRLKSSLHNYNELKLLGEWPEIPQGPVLKLGTWHKQVALLRKRLYQEGFLLDSEAVDENLFDLNVDEAVRKFQFRHGQEKDGIVGNGTRHSLNVSLGERINELKRNLERWRWLPRNLGHRYLMVNMAGYKLYVVEDDETVLKMPVIIGKPFKATPAFSDKLTYIEVNPPWNVPPRIAFDDILPKLKNDPTFLAQNNIRVYESWKPGAKELDATKIDWNNINLKYFPYKLQQDPGRTNNMGRVKFMFPNRFDVYLHDTPSIHLFKKAVRTFSSGCIRVAKPMSLAVTLLSAQKAWDKKSLRDQIKSGKSKKINLDEPIPIYLLYWTAWVEEDGIVHFRDDVYKRNRNIATKVEGQLTSS